MRGVPGARNASTVLMFVVAMLLSITTLGWVRLVQAEAPTALVVEEAATAAGSTLTARLAPVAALPGTTSTVGNLELPDGAVVRAPTFTPAASYATEGAAVAAVRSAVEPGLPAIEASLLAFMQAQGQTTAQWQYRTIVTVDGVSGAEQRTVTLGVQVWADGSRLRTGAKITAGATRVLYVSYEQKAVAAGLPAGWARPDAGNIRWQLFADDNAGTLTPISGVTVEAVNGAYDEPQDYADNEIDPQTGIERLAREWVAAKLVATKSSKAIIDYGRTVEPVYDEDANGNAIARVTVELPDRVFTAPSACDPQAQPKFEEHGSIGWELRITVDRYLLISADLVPDAQLSPIGQLITRSVSPTQPVDKTVYLAAGTSSSDFGLRVINPWNTPAGQENTVYDVRADTVNGLPADRYLLQGLRIVQQDTSNPWRWCGDVPGVGRVIADTASGALSVNGNTIGFGVWQYRQFRNVRGDLTITTTTMPGVAPAGGRTTSGGNTVVNCTDPAWRGTVRFDAGADARWRYVNAGAAFAFNAQLKNDRAAASPSADYMVLPPGTVVASARYSISNCLVNTAVTGWQSAARARLYRVMPSGNSITYTPLN